MECIVHLVNHFIVSHIAILFTYSDSMVAFVKIRLLIISHSRLSWIMFYFALVALTPDTAGAWGSQGHYQVGRVALEAVDETAKAQIQALLGSIDNETINSACNWPDQFRETPEGASSAPQHYVNIPHWAREYERERDCPDGLCVTEAIKKYAAQLADPARDPDTHWHAFAWLCHLVGDLHQPLHAGYRDDRGGNNREIIYQGEKADLHQFWDRLLIQERLDSSGGWQVSLPGFYLGTVEDAWSLSETDDWTNESHELVGWAAYPSTTEIQPRFAERSWLLIQNQWLKAGSRLARILNASIGDGKVVVTRRAPNAGQPEDG